MLYTGAGASKPSGVLTGNELARLWFEEIKLRFDENEVKAWMKNKRINEKNLGFFYSEIYLKRFSIDKLEGFEILQKVLERKEPSYGYTVLSQILSNSPHNIVITTNFDSLTEDALYSFTTAKPFICGHEFLLQNISGYRKTAYYY
ncbi:MAG: hypothetical protein WDO16_18645 [Bacteroidota bacterium]